MTPHPRTKRPDRSTSTSTGAGTEAAQGMKAVSGTRGGEPTRSKAGAVQPPEPPHAEKIAHPGSEPLVHRNTEHESGYGGKAAEPRVSSEQRERVAPNGSLRSESKKR